MLQDRAQVGDPSAKMQRGISITQTKVKDDNGKEAKD